MYHRVVIVGAGRLGDVEFFRKSVVSDGLRLLICCDGGARHLSAASMVPDVLMGDMDSIEPSLLSQFSLQGVKMVRHPSRKDYSDTALALDYAFALKPDRIDVWGALGGRIDHALANIHLLLKGKASGIPVRLIDEFCEVFIAGRETELRDAAGCLVSLIALDSQVSGITLAGFEYPLVRETLSVFESRGISNIVTLSRASICVETGNLLVIRYWRKDVFPEAV